MNLYLSAQKEGVSLVEAETWVKKHKSHRSFSKNLDEQIEKHYQQSSSVESQPLEQADPQDEEDLQAESILVEDQKAEAEADAEMINEDEEQEELDKEEATEDREDEEALINAFLHTTVAVFEAGEEVQKISKQ